MSSLDASWKQLLGNIGVDRYYFSSSYTLLFSLSPGGAVYVLAPPLTQKAQSTPYVVVDYVQLAPYVVAFGTPSIKLLPAMLPSWEATSHAQIHTAEMLSEVAHLKAYNREHVATMASPKRPREPADVEEDHSSVKKSTAAMHPDLFNVYEDSKEEEEEQKEEQEEEQQEEEQQEEEQEEEDDFNMEDLFDDDDAARETLSKPVTVTTFQLDSKSTTNKAFNIKTLMATVSEQIQGLEHVTLLDLQQKHHAGTVNKKLASTLGSIEEICAFMLSDVNFLDNGQRLFSLNVHNPLGENYSSVELLYTIDIKNLGVIPPSSQLKTAREIGQEERKNIRIKVESILPKSDTDGNPFVFEIFCPGITKRPRSTTQATAQLGFYSKQQMHEAAMHLHRETVARVTDRSNQQPWWLCDHCSPGEVQACIEGEGCKFDIKNHRILLVMNRATPKDHPQAFPLYAVKAIREGLKDCISLVVVFFGTRRNISPEPKSVITILLENPREAKPFMKQAMASLAAMRRAGDFSMLLPSDGEGYCECCGGLHRTKDCMISMEDPRQQLVYKERRALCNKATCKDTANCKYSHGYRALDSDDVGLTAQWVKKVPKSVKPKNNTKLSKAKASTFALASDEYKLYQGVDRPQKNENFTDKDPPAGLQGENFINVDQINTLSRQSKSFLLIGNKAAAPDIHSSAGAVDHMTTAPWIGELLETEEVTTLLRIPHHEQGRQLVLNSLETSTELFKAYLGNLPDDQLQAAALLANKKGGAKRWAKQVTITTLDTLALAANATDVTLVVIDSKTVQSRMHAARANLRIKILGCLKKAFQLVYVRTDYVRAKQQDPESMTQITLVYVGGSPATLGERDWAAHSCADGAAPCGVPV
jgi:hypothetical protein